MEHWAKLVTAVAAALSAVAWPAVFGGALIAFRKEISSFLTRLPSFLDRLRKMKIAGLVTELDAVADKASSTGEVTIEQTRAAAQIAMVSRELGDDQLFSELDKLCLQYDTLRRTMQAGSSRTLEMTRIIAKMRALGPSTTSRIEVYKGSGSPGSRLAAVAMMQMDPSQADLEWLVQRFRVEAPFIFYHASLALTNAANSRAGSERLEVIERARNARAIIQSFDGKPDQETLNVLVHLTTE